MNSPSLSNWRGTEAEWKQAVETMRASDDQRKRVLGWDRYRQLKMCVKLIANSEGTFRSHYYRDWPGQLERLWFRVMQDEHSVGRITGKRANMVIIDDPHNQETPVKTKAKKQPKKTYNTCAVRFMRGNNLAKVYTYKVPKKVKLHLGEEVVVPSLYDGFESNSIAVVVELHKEPQDNQGFDYKFITGRVQRLAAA